MRFNTICPLMIAALVKRATGDGTVRMGLLEKTQKIGTALSVQFGGFSLPETLFP